MCRVTLTQERDGETSPIVFVGIVVRADQRIKRSRHAAYRFALCKLNQLFAAFERDKHT